MGCFGRRVLAACLFVVGAGLFGCGGGVGSADQPLFVFGKTGGSLGRFIYPRAVVYSPASEKHSGEYYIADKSGRIQVFDASGKALRSWIMPKWEAGKPVGLGVAPDGRIFVPDTHYARVLVFDPNGQRLAEFGSFGDGPGQFRLPTDVAFDDEGYIYVSEYGGHDRVNKFTPDFQYLLSFADPNAGAASTQRPQGLLWDPEGYLWVADAGNHRICRFDRDGRLLAEFGELGTQAGQLRFPYGIDRFSDGTLVVAEYGNNRVQRFTPEGESLGVWGGQAVSSASWHHPGRWPSGRKTR
jgi:DNA-binding beta-propeller fold protein YncE